MRALIIVLVAVGAYLFGNINWALLITKFQKKSIREVGSGNPGTMNMLRSFGRGLGILTLILDILKGAIPCILGWFLIDGLSFASSDPVTLTGIVMQGGDRLGLYVGGFGVILGHVFPVFLKFKGGKGVACAIGVCLVAQPIVALITLTIGIVFLIFFKLGSIASFIIIGFPLGFEAFRISAAALEFGLDADRIASMVIVFATILFIVFTHRKNVYKLFYGTESRTVLFGKNRSAKKSLEEMNKEAEQGETVS
ncbi:MAG: glycerol-3-phosphate acyltransferase [Firmicutes bacterium]|nr:glycerol-3-phosphate acyltransferase [Bacillota bacterium]